MSNVFFSHTVFKSPTADKSEGISRRFRVYRKSDQFLQAENMVSDTEISRRKVHNSGEHCYFKNKMLGKQQIPWAAPLVLKNKIRLLLVCYFQVVIPLL